MSLLKHRLLALSSKEFSLGGGVAVGFRLAEEVEGWSEAKAWVCRNAVHEASRRSEAKGLDHSDTLEAEKRSRQVGRLASECIGRGRFGA